MKSVLIVVIILLITFSLIFFIRPNKPNKENFSNVPPVPSFSSAVNERGDRYNPLAAIVNPNIPAIDFTPENNLITRQATGTPMVSGQYQGELNVSAPQTNLRVPTKNTDLLEKIKMCESVKTVDCDAFKNDEFNKYCGISHYLDGKNYNGEPHIGGLYIDPTNKQNYLSKLPRPNPREFKPSFGISAPTKFSLNQDTCNIIKETIECETKKDFNSPNCVQCYEEDTWKRLDPSADKSIPKIFVGGSGMLILPDRQIRLTNNVISLPVSDDNFTEGRKIILTIQSINIPQDISAGIAASTERPRIFGYLEGSILSGGNYKYDIFLLSKDLSTGNKPKLFSTANMNIPRINGVNISLMGPKGTYGRNNYQESNELKLEITIPFTFINPNDQDSEICKTSPILTLKSSGQFLNSNLCARGKPGNYSLDCLKEKFLGAGGKKEGKGFPDNITKANAIQYDEQQRPRDETDICNFLSEMIIKAKIGIDNNNNRLSIREWNNASMFMLGIEVADPCSIYQPGEKVSNISDACLYYLYRNEGAGKALGSTYTAMMPHTSLLNKDISDSFNTYCTPGSPLDPTTVTGRQLADQQPNLQAVRALYDGTHKKAIDNSLHISQRTDAIKKCYNRDVNVPLTEEVFWVGPANSYTQDEAQEVCKEFESKLANKSQARIAHLLEAKFCDAGWVVDSEEAIKIGCDTNNDYEEVETDKAAALCFGFKPKKEILGQNLNKFKPFNEDSWNSKEVFSISSGVCSDLNYKVADTRFVQKLSKLGYTPDSNFISNCYDIKPQKIGREIQPNKILKDFKSGGYSAYSAKAGAPLINTNYGLAYTRDVPIDYHNANVAILNISNNTVRYLTYFNKKITLSKLFNIQNCRFIINQRTYQKWENRNSFYLGLPDGLMMGADNNKLVANPSKGPLESFIFEKTPTSPYLAIKSYFNKYLNAKTGVTVAIDGTQIDDNTKWLIIDFESLKQASVNLKTIELFEKINYLGRTWTLVEGRYTEEDLISLDILDNIQSAKIEDGLMLQIFKEDKFTSELSRYYEDTNNLSLSPTSYKSLVLKLGRKKIPPFGITANWLNLSCSSDGQILLATVSTSDYTSFWGNYNTFVSKDGGVNFISKNISSYGNFMSSDGSLLMVHTNCDSGYLYKSVDQGDNFLPTLNFNQVHNIAGSPDGKTIYLGILTGYDYISTDGGNTFKAVNGGYFQALKVSNNGIIFRSMGSWYSSGFSVSNNYGSSFTDVNIPNVISIAASINGDISYLISNNNLYKGDKNFKYTLVNGVSNLECVTCSYDGTNIVVAGYDNIYISKDQGLSWENIKITGKWRTICSDANCDIIYVGGIFTRVQKFILNDSKKPKDDE